ncbi:unnamed protein product [Darwinula stevensoni]|uniref:Spindle assembly abnormal protein 6 N-terminal domain-containing protein n=1 Tax=Darwinula stevensoni TaxID=69355 RepID=A0A7R9AGH3_9CRUS|nr:unnamed protein product [Darwinula stevensoni]CAG0903410.1 unnamed protein product [Darwinula stevensoni]
MDIGSDRVTVRGERLDATILYDKVLSVHDRTIDGCGTKVSRRFLVTTRLSAVNSKELEVLITADEEPCLFLNLKIQEDDFQALKSQQGLLVDFQTFPQRFLDLLDLCSRDGENEHPRFLLHLSNVERGGQGPARQYLLEVVESNPFKHLCHLALKLNQGTDSQVKNFLAATLLRLKTEKEQLQLRLRGTEDSLAKQLEGLQIELDRRTQEVDSARRELKETTAMFTSRLEKDLYAERDKASQTQSTCIAKYETQLKDLEQKHARTSQQLEARITGLDAHNRDLQEKKVQAEAHVRELRGKCSSLELDASRLRQELNSTRQQLGSRDSDAATREKELAQLRTRLAVSEQEARDRDLVGKRQLELLSSAQEQKSRLETQLEALGATLVRREESIRGMSQELFKANQIIKKLQDELHAQLNKLKLRTQVATEQEKVIGEKEAELKSLKEEVEARCRELRRAEDEKQKLEERNQELEQRIRDSEKIIKTNENVINWLNKQVTAGMQIGGGRDHSGPSLVSSTPSLPSSRLPPLGVAAPAQMPSAIRDIPSGFNPKDKENEQPIPSSYLQPVMENPILVSGLMRAPTPVLEIPSVGLSNKSAIPRRNYSSKRNPGHKTNSPPIISAYFQEKGS